MAVIAWRQAVFVFRRGAKHAHTPRQSILYFQQPTGTEDGQDLPRWRRFGMWSGSGAGNGTTQSVTERQITLPSLRFHRLPTWLGLRRVGPNRHFLCCHLNAFQLDMANRRQLERSSQFQLRTSWWPSNPKTGEFKDLSGARVRARTTTG